MHTNNLSNNNPDYYMRPIHYLGSKLRMLDEIKFQVDRQIRPDGIVCDLFAGSGTVSRFLSSSRSVVSSDAQEYSKVLCGALLQTPETFVDAEVFIEKCKLSENSKLLHHVFHELLQYETESLNNARANNNVADIADIIDYGSILDYEYYPFIMGNNSLQSKLERSIFLLKESGLDQLPNALTIRYFGGSYFSYHQAIAIDCILEEIHRCLYSKTRNLLLAALLSTVSDCVNTIGKQFAQPLQMHNSEGLVKTNLIQKVLKDRGLDIFSSFKSWINKYQSLKRSNYNHHFVKAILPEELKRLDDYQIDVFYADPPYTRYHYSRYYHVLETLCLRDNPKISNTDRGTSRIISRGKYRIDRLQSDFCINSKAETAFDSMFSYISERNTPLVLSYSPFDGTKAVSPRLQTIDQLIGLAGNYFHNIEIVNISKFKHSKLNTSSRALETNKISEVLICCR